MIDWSQYRVWVAEAFLGGRLAPVITTLSVVLLAYSAAQLTWMIVPLPAVQTPPPVAAAPVASMPDRVDALSLGRQIVARHLFGQVQTALPDQDAVAIPETQLRLVLRGVMASTDPRTATAIVADPSGKEDFYTVGAALPGGATLKEVHAQHIVLSRGGRFETLRLPENTLKVSTGEVANPNAQPLTVSPEAGALLKQYRQQFVQNPQSLANLLQGEPFWENGHLIGYRLRPGRDASVLAKFGIQSGDVVTAINGVSLVDPAGRMELLRNFANAEQFNVDLLRNGQPYSIAIPLGGPG